jgi:transcriptional regulator with XRE-family HTH domain
MHITKPRGRSRGRQSDGSANPVDTHVGRRVRLRRTLLGISQEKLGEAMGLTFQQVQKYERGANRISASRLYDLARILDVSVSFFFGDMPADVAAASPARISSGDNIVSIVADERDPTDSRETLELVRAYYRIVDVAVRKKVLDLARALGGEG